jgi:hypothetical protein
MTFSFTQTEPTQSLTSILQLLRTLTEPGFVVHVGAGRGVGELNTWQSWGLPKALIIEADGNRLAWAHHLCAQHPGWKIAEQVISTGDSEVQYHLASNPDEDSLVPMHRLNSIWANIRTVKTQTVPTTSLDRLLSAEWSEDDGQQTTGTWCLIDCLPADVILSSAEDSLAQMSVVVARVVLTDLSEENSAGRLSAVLPYLQTKGFKCLSVLETTHPSIGHAVFIRDFKATYEQNIDAMQDQLQTGKVLITRQSEQLSEQRLQLDRLVVDRDTQLETVTSLSQTLEAQALELYGVRQQLSQMEAAQADAEQGKLALQGRQTHLHDDLVRAEAQIDLIKELMFTPPSLKG